MSATIKRLWCVLAAALVAGCDADVDPSGEACAVQAAMAAKDSVQELGALPTELAEQPAAPSGTGWQKKDRCCFALCEGTGAYFKVGYVKSECETDAENFCALYSEFDPSVGALVNDAWLVCG